MSIDNYNKTTDNASIDDNNENYEVIKLENSVPLIDLDCKHNFVEDDDVIDDLSQSWICTKCKRGTFLPKGVKIINS